MDKNNNPLDPGRMADALRNEAYTRKATNDIAKSIRLRDIATNYYTEKDEQTGEQLTGVYKPGVEVVADRRTGNTVGGSILGGHLNQLHIAPPSPRAVSYVDAPEEDKAELYARLLNQYAAINAGYENFVRKTPNMGSNLHFQDPVANQIVFNSDRAGYSAQAVPEKGYDLAMHEYGRPLANILDTVGYTPKVMDFLTENAANNRGSNLTPWSQDRVGEDEQTARGNLMPDAIGAGLKQLIQDPRWGQYGHTEMLGQAASGIGDLSEDVSSREEYERMLRTLGALAVGGPQTDNERYRWLGAYNSSRGNSYTHQAQPTVPMVDGKTRIDPITAILNNSNIQDGYEASGIWNTLASAFGLGKEIYRPSQNINTQGLQSPPYLGPQGNGLDAPSLPGGATYGSGGGRSAGGGSGGSTGGLTTTSINPFTEVTIESAGGIQNYIDQVQRSFAAKDPQVASRAEELKREMREFYDKNLSVVTRGSTVSSTPDYNENWNKYKQMEQQLRNIQEGRITP